MASANETGFKTFTATAVAIPRNTRVLLDSSGTISAAGVSDEWIGTTVEDCAASGTVTVRLRNQSGTHFFIASAAVTAGAKLYAAASGKVDDGSTVLAGGAPIGFEAVTAASADGDIIEAAPSSELATGAPVIFQFPINLATIANGDLLTDFPLGFAGKIVGFYASVTSPATTGSKLSTLNLEIGSTNLTGGSLALTSANMTPLGAVVSASAITAGNTFAATDVFSIEAASTTAFVEGSIVLTVICRAL
ncbi:MAG: hypothetical protein EBS84_19455 [Proteobacteria bacterium]|nr:hypothetical protein [Verrucomicrobiota bacterium]NBU11164.1 hypothetical protein [Pseudomonadota bacterium]